MQIDILSSACELPDADWARLARGHPFLSQAYLGACEQLADETSAAALTGPQVGAGKTAPDRGSIDSGRWRARHLVARDDAGRTQALLPMYLSRHGAGDLSNDSAWSAALTAAGRPCYPKLLSAVPHTPCEVPHVLVGDECDADSLGPVLIRQAQAHVRAEGCAAWQCLHLTEQERAWVAGAGALLRREVQFQWHNRGYRHFDGFLAQLRSARRCDIRRERQRIADLGLVFEHRDGRSMTPDLWATIHAHYRHTYQRYGSWSALTEPFFASLGAALGERMHILLARESPHGPVIASVVAYLHEDTMYVRHWGSSVTVSELHFEMCYYRPIEYCIAQGLQRIDSGATGEHKLARGFLPVDVWSAHWYADPHAHAVVAEFIRDEERAVATYSAAMMRRSPYLASTGDHCRHR